MIAARSYVYKGKRYELDDKLSAVLSGLAGLEHLVVMGRAAVSPAGNRANCLTWDQVCDVGGAALTFERLPFSHPPHSSIRMQSSMDSRRRSRRC
jgi:acetoacetyl-CoA synthetase